MNYKDKIAIVTGASSGIGRATAELLDKKGAKVALVARSQDKLISLSKNLTNAFVVPTDMGDEKAVLEMVEKIYSHFGTIDILINCAGVGYDSAIEDIDIALYKKLFSVNVIGSLLLMQHVIPIMRKQKKGAIVNVSSGTALMSLPHMGAYSSLKRALAGLSLTANEELKKDTISVSVVYPFITKTNFEQNTITNKGQKNEDDSIYENTSLPKADLPEQVAEKILYAIDSGDPEVYAHDWMNPHLKRK